MRPAVVFLALWITTGAIATSSRSALADPPLYYSGRWQLTQYWIAQERTFPDDHRAVVVRNRDGNVLVRSCSRFVADLSMEGTGQTWDGRLLNWDQRVRGHACFVEVDRNSYPYGAGVAGFALVPLRSLAVDRRFIPLGHTVEIQELAGIPLADGSRHDGCFVAVDGGGAINGHHIDLFVPSEQMFRDLGLAGYLPSSVRRVVVDSPRCAYARMYAVTPVPGDPITIP